MKEDQNSYAQNRKTIQHNQPLERRIRHNPFKRMYSPRVTWKTGARSAMLRFFGEDN
jgi:hypothetical protein